MQGCHCLCQLRPAAHSTPLWAARRHLCLLPARCHACLSQAQCPTLWFFFPTLFSSPVPQGYWNSGKKAHGGGIGLPSASHPGCQSGTQVASSCKARNVGNIGRVPACAPLTQSTFSSVCMNRGKQSTAPVRSWDVFPGRQVVWEGFLTEHGESKYPVKAQCTVSWACSCRFWYGLKALCHVRC